MASLPSMFGHDRSMPRKVLRGRGHARLAHALHRGHREARDHLRVVVIGAVADDLAYAVVEVDTGGKAQVHAYGAKFRC